jgi:hypothetical protein
MKLTEEQDSRSFMATEWTDFPSASAVYFVIVNIDLTHEPSEAPKNIGFLKRGVYSL